MPAKAPAFQFYARDFLVATATMSLEETGAYIRLLSQAWDEGGIPADPERRARLLGITRAEHDRIWEAIAAKWKPAKGGRLVNPRLETERKKQARHRAQARKAGQASARSRAGKTQRPLSDR